MKNTFKGAKLDAKGNELNEQIGKGRNEEHINKVIAERKLNESSIKLKDSTLSLKIESELHNRLIQKSEIMEVPKSFIVQELIKNFLK